MSAREKTIVCRSCKEEIPLSSENCPHCGTSIRNRSKLIVVGLFGAVLLGGSLFRISDLWLFGLLGLALAGLSAYLVYDQRQRVSEAEAGGESVLQSTDKS